MPLCLHGYRPSRYASKGNVPRTWRISANRYSGSYAAEGLYGLLCKSSMRACERKAAACGFARMREFYTIFAVSSARPRHHLIAGSAAEGKCMSTAAAALATAKLFEIGEQHVIWPPIGQISIVDRQTMPANRSGRCDEILKAIRRP